MKPLLANGTRDFGPAEMQKRHFIFSIIKRNFELFGYQPLETPAVENLATLTGKYGDEGDRLIFKILNSGEYLSKFKTDEELIATKHKGENAFTKLISEKALRYDLTVPFARYVVMNNHALTYPFKRYQIQPVWRADRPQKGRYREFYQCDADVIGSNSLLNELELMGMMDKSFKELNIPVTLKFNNRKILSGIAEVVDEKENIIAITVAIDKLDKIGKDGVVKELQEKGIKASAIEKLAPLFDFSGDNATKLSLLKTFLAGNAIGEKGIEEIDYLLNNALHLNLQHIVLELDITLARGLNYYTGTIFEAKANAGSLSSSILGGGRYDDLTGIFGLKNLSGVGISFGIDRIYDIMNELELFPKEIGTVSTTKVLFVNFGMAEETHCLSLVGQLRAAGINCELYPEAAKMKKQFEYADKKRIPFVCIVGSEEMAKGQYTLKDLASGEQQSYTLQQLMEHLH